jgi:tripartite-type tricarboxylate transporter receptor subunit TctC
MIFFQCVITALLAVVCVAPARAQDYPVKPIRMIIPFVPGGANDVFGRLVGMKITEAHGQQVVIENRGGAGGSIGVELAAKSPPDGYTLVLGNIANLSVNPTLYRKLGYNPLTDLQPITLIAKLPSILVVHPSLPAKNVKELVALARAQPARLTFGTGGGGSGSHLTMELFKLQSKVDLIHVPYKGVGPAMIDLLAGQITMAFGAVPGAGPYVRSGRLRALGVSSAARIAAYPEGAHHRASGPARLRGDVVVWRVGAGGHADGYCESPARHHHARHAIVRYERTLYRRRRRAGGQHAAGISRVYQE